MDSRVPILLDRLGKRFRRRVALDGVSLETHPGEVFGYLGPNGAGKTTTIRILMGMLRPTSGRAHVFGVDSWRDAVPVHRLVGYVPGDPSVYSQLTGRQHVDYLGHLRGRDDRAAAHAIAERLGLELDRPARALSRGNRQKLALTLALMSEPRLLILDEPTSSLDPLVQREVHALLREHTDRGGSVLLSSHVLGEVQRVADRIGIVKEGRLVAVERLDELIGKSLHHIRATFDDDVTAGEFSSIPGVRDLVIAARTLSCSAPRTALDAVIKRAGAHRVADFECAEAELEETFLAFYGAPRGGDRDAGDGTGQVAL